MSLDALTKDELKALIAYNLEQIKSAIAPYPHGDNLIPGDWERIRRQIMHSVSRIDRIVALNKGAA